LISGGDLLSGVSIGGGMGLVALTVFDVAELPHADVEVACHLADSKGVEVGCDRLREFPCHKTPQKLPQTRNPEDIRKGKSLFGKCLCHAGQTDKRVGGIL
jgi:hypothetical protein